MDGSSADKYLTLDLHGQTAEQAVRVTERWLRERQAARELSVRVVTGRGLHSVGPPVLPEAITARLTRLRGTLVEAFTRAPGGGSIEVRLRRPRREPADRPSTGAALDPQLVRLAEEALADLGVAPTPALIAVEVERLARERARESG